MKLDRGFRFPCVTVKKIKIEVKSTSSPDQKVKAQNSFIHAGFQNHKGSNPTSEMSKISFSCGLDNKKSRTRNLRSGFFIVSDKPPEQERTVFLKQSARGENIRRSAQ